MRQEILDDPVLQRMEGHRHQPAAGAQHAFRGREAVAELAELVVDEQPQGLERPGGGMDVARPAVHTPPTMSASPPWSRSAAPAAPPRWPGRRHANAVPPPEEDDVGKAVFRAAATISAADGPALLMRMSSGPSCRNEKPRSAVSICIDETPRSRTTPSTEASRVRRRCDPARRTRPEPGSAGRRNARPRRLAGGHRIGIAVDPEDAGIPGREDRCGVTSAAIGAVEVGAAVVRCEVGEDLPQQHGNVTRGPARWRPPAAVRRLSCPVPQKRGPSRAPTPGGRAVSGKCDRSPAPARDVMANPMQPKKRNLIGWG